MPARDRDFPAPEERLKWYNVGMSMTYDLIVPLGFACSCSQALRRAGLQLASFPWDWVGTPPPSERCRLICNGFKDWMNLEDLQWAGKNDTYGHEEVRNVRSGLIIMHDFAHGVSIEEQYPAIAEKYARRIARLDKLLRESKKVLLVHIDTPVSPTPLPNEDCQKSMEIMSAKYPDVEFSFLLLSLEPGRTLENRVDETPLPNLRRIAFDFKSYEPDAPVFGIDVETLANLLKAEYRVRDYRSKEEIAAYAKKKRGKRDKKLRRKMEEFGASTMPQYVLHRIRRVWRKVLSAAGPRALAARAVQREYKQMLLLGANRETAFRLHERWRFTETSLFSAASSGSLAALADALKRPDAIAKGLFTLDEPKQAWHSADFGLEFKVKLQWKEGKPPPAKAQMDEDLADLRGRLEKLAEDFRRRLANDEETLLVYRLAEGEGPGPDLAERLDGLEAAIAALGARNWKLLVVCRESDLAKMPPPSANRIYRSVRRFTPDEHETWGELGDPVGWSAIFTEFAPAAKSSK